MGAKLKDEDEGKNLVMKYSFSTDTYLKSNGLRATVAWHSRVVIRGCTFRLTHEAYCVALIQLEPYKRTDARVFPTGSQGNVWWELEIHGRSGFGDPPSVECGCVLERFDCGLGATTAV